MVAVLVALGLLTALRLNAYALLGTEVAVTGLLGVRAVRGQRAVAWCAGRDRSGANRGAHQRAGNATGLPPDMRQAARVLAHDLALHLQTAWRTPFTRRHEKVLRHT